MHKKYFFFIILFIFAAAVSRLIPHPWNFTPLGAVGLLAGKYLPKKWAIIVPIFALLVSDIFLGFYNWKLMVVVYASITVYACFGIFLRKRSGFLPTATLTLSGSLQFFLITNFAVWALSSWYPHTFTGLLAAYTLALPFFKYTLMGDVFYVSVLLGAVWVVERAFLYKRLQESVA